MILNNQNLGKVKTQLWMSATHFNEKGRQNSQNTKLKQNLFLTISIKYLFWNLSLVDVVPSTMELNCRIFSGILPSKQVTTSQVPFDNFFSYKT